MTGVRDLKELQLFLELNGIKSIQSAMRSRDLAKLGDPLTNLIHSLAQSLLAGKFEGEKVSGKTLAMALRLAKLRQLAPSRLDSHGLGDAVEALIAYAWIQGSLKIPEAARLLTKELKRAIKEKPETKSKTRTLAIAFAKLLQKICEDDQDDPSEESQ